MTEEEKLAEEFVSLEVPFDTTESGTELFLAADLEYAFIAGYEQGIGRLRYCCTCKHYSTCLDEDEDTAMYGICGDWEIKE